jgi:hypothetical protein
MRNTKSSRDSFNYKNTKNLKNMKHAFKTTLLQGDPKSDSPTTQKHFGIHLHTKNRS